MITSKHISAIVIALVCVCLAACGFIVYAANTFDTTKTTEYQRRMFGDEVANIEIEVDANEWQDIMNNAQAKEWISADVIINGTRSGTVGIRTKGNSSLTTGSRMSGSTDDSDDYSLSFKSNKYVKGQTFFGLDSFCINNMMGDTTYMKDYIAYDIMNYIGVDTPLVNYAKVTVNGEDYGFGIMLERYDEAFLDRVYSTSAGELYSVKIGMGQRGDFEGMWQDMENNMPQQRQRTATPDSGEQGADNGGFAFGGNIPQGGERPQNGGFSGMGSMGGGSLVYTDDNPDSYSSIFSNSVKNSDKISDKDKEKVITALKNLNDGTNLEKYIDVDATLRYFAAHTVMVNNDSYTSNMAQNYYLYERDGQLTILPWDYNLSFGGMGAMGGTSDASGVVNFPIDTPVSGVSMEDRPLLSKLLEVPEYMELYHKYLRQIVEGYFESGLYEQIILELDAKINDYVKNDISANYTYEQYKASLPQLIELLCLRGESIKGQLDGKIPSTSSGQNADSSSLIDASGVNLNALGSMGGGAMGGRFGESQNGQSDGQDGMPNMPGGQQPGGFGGVDGNMPDMQFMQQAMQILTESGGELTEEAKTALLELGLTEEQINLVANIQNSFPGMGGGMAEQGGFPGGQQVNPQDGIEIDAPPESATQSGINTGYIILVSILVLFLIGATIFIAKPRKNDV